ncbi:MAG: acylphosphatase [Brevinematales bacterium]|nr:acylphosphatase [Brevinematales bacterium]
MLMLRAIVRGRVQGVGFRYFVQRRAENIGLTGWVKNLYSGDVQIEACGSDEQVSALIEELRKGPPMSDVTDVEYSAEPVDKCPFLSFDVRF